MPNEPEVLILPTMGDHPTANPDGVTNSIPDYFPKTQEEKAQLLGVQFATPIEVDLDVDPLVAPLQPYPDGSPMDEADRDAMLARVHSPMELVEGADQAEQQAKNLAAGGSVEGSNPGPSQADLQRDEGSPGTLPGGGSVTP